MFGIIVRWLIVAAIFIAWFAVATCVMAPATHHRAAPPDAATDAPPDSDTSPHGYFGRPDAHVGT